MAQGNFDRGLEKDPRAAPAQLANAFMPQDTGFGWCAPPPDLFLIQYKSLDFL
jgi:hypothetical protein